MSRNRRSQTKKSGFFNRLRRSQRRRRRQRDQGRRLFGMEPLEDRRLLTAVPTLSVPGAQSVDEGQVLDVAPAITVDDVDSSNLWVAMSVDNGSLTLGTAANLTFLGGTSNGESSLVLEGAKADLNTALATLDYQGDPGFNGSDALNVTAFDSTTYDYVGAVLSTGSAPYNTAHVEGSLTIDPGQLGLLAGDGGQSVTAGYGGAGDFVQSYTMTVLGPSTNLDRFESGHHG